MGSAKRLVFLYLLLIPVCFSIDLVWLGLVAADFYDNQIGFLLAKEVNWLAALLFYLLYIASIVYFAILPGITKDSVKISALNGAFLGFIAYATYDLTNLATLKDWPVTITIVDLFWGTVLTMTVAIIGWKIATSWLKIKPQLKP